jgi:hypothetical protein
MFRRHNKFLAAATAYVEQGIAVRPAPALVRASSDQDAFGRWTCSCGDLLCEAPGEHVTGGDWITDRAMAEEVWKTETPPNLLICSGPALALWRLPRVAGAYGLRLYEQQRPGPWAPYLQLPAGDWILATLPTDHDDDLAAGVEYLPPGVPVLVPPSRRRTDGFRSRILEPGGQLLWRQAPAFPRTPLPAAADVLTLVRQAEQEYYELTGAQPAS